MGCELYFEPNNRFTGYTAQNNHACAALLNVALVNDLVGEYVRLVGRPKPGLALGGGLRAELERALSEAAVA